MLFAVDKDCRDTLRLTRRALRDEFQQRAADVHRAARLTLAAATAAQELDAPQRARRAGTLDDRAAQLRDLDRAVGVLTGTDRRG